MEMHISIKKKKHIKRKKKNIDCAICLNPIKEHSYSTKCCKQKKLHSTCSIEYMLKTKKLECPLCRQIGFIDFTFDSHQPVIGNVPLDYILLPKQVPYIWLPDEEIINFVNMECVWCKAPGCSAESLCSKGTHYVHEECKERILNIRFEYNSFTDFDRCYPGCDGTI